MTVALWNYVIVPAPEHRVGMVADFTDVVILKDGRSFYSRLQGHIPISQQGYVKAEFERRQRPGFYRVNG